MAKAEGNEPKLIDRYLAADWPRMREKGRSYFIWRRLVLPFGVPTAVFGAAWQYRQLHFGASDLLTGPGIGLIYVSFFFGIASAYAYGAFEWNKRESAYLREHGRDSDPKNPSNEEE
jgi:hypothetical protein